MRKGIKSRFAYFSVPALTVVILTVAPDGAAAGGRGGRKSPPARRPNSAPAAASRARTLPGGLTAGSLAASLRSLGYSPRAAAPYQRLQVEEPGYGYALDVGLTPSADWLVFSAHLAPIPDLTKVPSAPLLALLSQNDALLGMAFGYNREQGRLMLTASVPNRDMDAGSLRNIVEGIKKTVRETAGLWNTRNW